MKNGKRIFLFMAVNILIIATLSIVTSVLGIQPYLDAKGINYTSLLVFCTIWGFGGAFISLALSRKMAKWMMGVKLIDQSTRDSRLQSIVLRVHEYSKRAGLTVMPEVGVYDSPDVNAFATGPSRSRSLVAVSTGLLDRMNDAETEGVLAHEVAHIANGDMVTMTLIQGVINVFVMFLARILANIVGQFVDENKRFIVQFAVIIALEILLGMLGMLVVSAFSRKREFRADLGGAKYAGKEKMLAALTKLKVNSRIDLSQEDDQPALASFKISGKASRFSKLFSTHPDLDDRIERLTNSRLG